MIIILHPLTGIYSTLKIYAFSKLARLRRPKITCSPSYVDYRPKTNAVILLDMGHTLREEHTWEG
jgi:hypothetical protein